MELLQKEIYYGFFIIICLFISKRVYSFYIKNKRHKEIIKAINNIKKKLNEPLTKSLIEIKSIPKSYNKIKEGFIDKSHNKKISNPPSPFTTDVVKSILKPSSRIRESVII
jgi:hypothetical protein